MLTDDLRQNILKRFPDIKLSYDKTLHNKVYADLFMIIPKGPKAFLWFTYIDNNNVAILLILNKHGNIKSVDVYPMCFNRVLSLGTLIYGTYFDINGRHHFTFEEIYTYKGVNVAGKSLADKLNIYTEIFGKELLQKTYNNSFIMPGLPIWTANYNSAVEIANSLPYKVYGIKFYNMKQHNGKSVGIYIHKEVIVRETGSITGSIEGDLIEIHGHMDGKISGDDVVIGSSGTVKGDIEFSNNLKTENGADIDGYIKKSTNSKSKLSADFLFSKSKEDKKSREEEQPETVVNKDSEALA